MSAVLLPNVSVADLALGIQGWAGVGDPDRTRSMRPGRTNRPYAKPRSGFFTASWNAVERSTPWVEFMRTSPRTPRPDEQLWTFTPDPVARLYVIDNLGDYERLADAYPQRWDPRTTNRPDYAPDWWRIGDPDSLPFTGVHVTQAAADALGNAVLFFGWDVESTLWFEWRLADCHCEGRLTDNWVLQSC
jgi:hypothetical protein